MTFENVLGLEHIKTHLKSTIANGRVPHAQLFVGAYGSGTLATAIAFASELILSQIDEGRRNEVSQLLDGLNHPDLHFVYPINSTPSIKNPVSTDFIREWQSFVLSNPYQSVYDWTVSLGIENKISMIKVSEASGIIHRLSLKSFSGGPKVLIIWGADRSHTSTFNKLLKLIEEPPENTYLILISDSPEDILLTIKSRCQFVDFPPLSEHDIAQGLMNNVSLSTSEASQIAQQSDGNFYKALQILQTESDDSIFEKWFITWVRSAFRAKGNKHVVSDLLDWSDMISAETRETQKRFISYCIQFFRQALLNNYNAKSLVFFKFYDSSFKFDKFSEFITGSNIGDIFFALETAFYHVERNGNPKLIFSDLSFQLTRFLHKKNP